jgi:hypothetical protein
LQSAPNAPVLKDFTEEHKNVLMKDFEPEQEALLMADRFKVAAENIPATRLARSRSQGL